MNRLNLSHNSIALQHTPVTAVWMGAFVCRYMAKRSTGVGRKETFLN